MWSLCCKKQEDGVGGWGGGRLGSPSWNRTVVRELQPKAFPGPGQQLFSSPHPPRSGSPGALEDCSWKEWAEGTVTSGLREGSRVACAFICISLARARPLCSHRGGRRGRAIVWGERVGGGSWGGKGLKVPSACWAVNL